MTKRSEQKQEARARILDAGAAHVRGDGLDGAGIAAIMRDAGLTHGTFYAHFTDKADLAEASFRHALAKGRSAWTRGEDQSWHGRLARLARRYLTPKHRDHREEGCAFAALGADAARAPAEFRRAFGEELQRSIDAVCAAPEDGPVPERRRDDAILLLSLCVGGMTLARGVGDRALSDRILGVCRAAMARETGPLLSSGGNDNDQ